MQAAIVAVLIFSLPFTTNGEPVSTTIMTPSLAGNLHDSLQLSLVVNQSLNNNSCYYRPVNSKKQKIQENIFTSLLLDL